MWRLAALCFFVLACAASYRYPRVPEPVVHVVNDNWFMMHVYSDLGGLRMRAGEVGGGQSAFLSIKADGTSTCQVALQAFVSDEQWESAVLPCAPGDTLELHVQPLLAATMLVPR